jgi:hypothetical protein
VDWREDVGTESDTCGKVSDPNDRTPPNDCRPDFRRPWLSVLELDLRRLVSVSLLLPPRAVDVLSESLPCSENLSNDVERRRDEDTLALVLLWKASSCALISAVILDDGNSTSGDMGKVRSAGILESCLPVRMDLDGLLLFPLMLPCRLVRESVERRLFGFGTPLSLRAVGFPDLLVELLSLMEDSVSFE